MPVINANGCDFYYQMEGRGPDIVFIHGEIQGSTIGSTSLRSLRPTIAALPITGADMQRRVGPITASPW